MQRSEMGIRGIVRRPMRFEWTRPPGVSLSAEEKRVLQIVQARNGLPTPEDLKGFNGRAGSLAAAILSRNEAQAFDLQLRAGLAVNETAGFWASAFHEAFDVALKTCPENPVAYTRAISDPGSQYHFFDLALCLHGHSVALEGITFRFVVNIQAIQGAMQLEIGCQVLKDAGLSPLSSWETPWRKRDKYSFLNGQNVFTSEYGNPEFDDRIGERWDINNNYFSTEDFEGLGWVWVDLSSAYIDRPEWIVIREVQEDKYFLAEIQRQQHCSSGHRKKLKSLMQWTHIIVSALEDLGRRHNYYGVVSRTTAWMKKGNRFYDGLFGKRYSESGEPLYKIEQGDVYLSHQIFRSEHWVYRF